MSEVKQRIQSEFETERKTWRWAIALLGFLFLVTGNAVPRTIDRLSAEHHDWVTPHVVFEQHSDGTLSVEYTRRATRDISGRWRVQGYGPDGTRLYTSPGSGDYMRGLTIDRWTWSAFHDRDPAPPIPWGGKVCLGYRLVADTGVVQYTEPSCFDVPERQE